MNNNYFNYNPSSLFRAPVMPISPTQAAYTPLRGALTSSIPRAGIIGSAGASKITFSSILNGASKTLGVINQAIPVFYQVKPIWNNAKTMFRVAKEIRSSDNKTTSSNTNNRQNNNVNSSNSTQKKESDNSPTFFI